jgi:hypothetical protein
MGIEVTKTYGYTASVVENTNKVVASSKADWGAIQPGNLICLGEDEDFLKIVKKEKFFFIKDAEVSTNEELLVREDTNIKLSVEDTLTITHKEYQVSDIVKIKSGGTGYEVGDVLKPHGGLCKFNSYDGVDVPASLKVEEVDENGEIKSLSLESNGIYNVAPDNICELDNGLGSNATIEIKTELIENRTIEHRTITAISFEEGNTKIKLDHPLPPRVHEVKISVDKYQIILEVNYPHESKFNVDYQVIKDFSSHMKMPFMHRGSSINHQVYNQALYKLDKKIKQLEERLYKLDQCDECSD